MKRITFNLFKNIEESKPTRIGRFFNSKPMIYLFNKYKNLKFIHKCEWLRIIPDTLIHLFPSKKGRLVEFTRRYHLIHVVAKGMLFKPLLKIFMKVLDKHLIKDLSDIPAEPHNNLQRIAYWSYDQAIDHVFQTMCHNMGRGKKELTPKGYLRWCKKGNFWSYSNRKNVQRILMTEELEDSVDREIQNKRLLFQYHALHEFFKGNVPKPNDYPMYCYQSPHELRYFVHMMCYGVWKPKKQEYKLRDIVSELKSFDIKQVNGGKK